MDIPNTDDAGSLFDRLTDYSSWSPRVWGFLAILIVLGGLVWLWNNMSGKAQLLIVTVLGVVVAALLMT